MDSGPGADAAMPDAPGVGEATAIVFHDEGAELGTPEAGVTVLFHGRDGGMSAAVITDADGKASWAVGRDAMITVVRTRGTILVQSVTRTHVQPGDVLRFGPTAPAPPRLATMTVTWTTPPNSGSVGHFDVVTPCGNGFAFAGERSATVAINDTCRDRTFPVFVIARVNGSFINQSGLDNQRAVDGGAIHLTSWLGPTIVTSELTNLPAGATAITGMAQTIRGRLFNTDSRPSLPGQTIKEYRLSSVADSELEEEIELRGASQIQVISQRGPFALRRTTDVAAALAPSMTAGFDVATRTWTWTTQAPAAPDVQVAFVRYNRGSLTFTWSVVGPNEGNSLALPSVPFELDDLLPLASDQRDGALSHFYLGNGLTFDQIQGTLMQWMSVGDPNNSPPVRWLTAPANLDAVTRSDAVF